MKSERRHELQQNELAIYLDRVNKSIEPYSRIIALVIGLLIIGSIGLVFYNTEQRGQRSVATLNLIQASASQDAEQLLTVSDKYPDTEAGAWARLYQGRQYLVQGIQTLYSDRTDAEQLLGDARAAFLYAISISDDPLLRSRAQFGIARAAESLGNIDEAVDAYREVIAVNESEAMVKKAEDRIETLASPETKEFLAWFADQDFSPADPSLPPALPGGDALPDLPDLNLPELNLPGLPGLSSDADEKMELKDGGIEMPKEAAAKDSDDDAAKEGDSSKSEQTTAAEKPAAEKPAAEKPAAEKPAAEKPAAEKPAAEKPAAEKPAAEKPAAEKPAKEEASTEDSASDTPQ